MAPYSLVKSVRDQWTSLPSVEKLDLTGRTVIISGSNIGLGLEAARHFARMNPEKLILAVRTLSKGEDAKAEIIKSAPRASMEVWKLDMSSMKSVQEFASRVNKDLKRLDVAILNAGIQTKHWSTSSHGYESTLQTNVISTGLLGLLLLPKLEETAKLPALATASNLKPHLTITGSEVHWWTKNEEGKDAHPIHALNDEKRFNGKDRYNVSKLLNLFLARDIGKLTNKVVVNVVHPGLCHSGLSRDKLSLDTIIFSLMKAVLARTSEEGSRCLVWAATNDTPQGAYSASCRVEEESDYSLSSAGKDAQRKSWEDLKEIWVKQAPGVKAVLA